MSVEKTAVQETIEWLKSEPQNHGTFALARDAHNSIKSVLDPEACNYCALGYIAMRMGVDAFYTGEVAEALGAQAIEGMPELLIKVAHYNDRHNLPKTIEYLEKVVELLP